MRRPLLVLLAALTALWWIAGGAGPAAADGPYLPPGPGFDGDTIFAIDAAVAGNGADVDVAETLLLLIEATQTSGSVALFIYAGAGDSPARLDAGSPEAAAAFDGAIAELRSGTSALPSLQFPALGTMLTYLYEIAAGDDSRAFLITDGRSARESDSSRERLESFAEAFSAEGWTLNTVMVPSASPEHRDLLARLAATTGGRSFDGGTADGLAALATHVTGATPTGAIDSELTGGSSALATVEVAPATESLRVAFVRESSSVDVRLFNPQGVEANLRRSDVAGIETPNVILLTVNEPTPGSWTVQASGSESRLLAGASAPSPLGLSLVVQPPLPAGQDGVLQARLLVDGNLEALSGAFVEATVRQPDGSTRVYRLTDNGLDADEKAGDGIFSSALTASVVQGVNDVRLELGWLDQVGLVRASGSFQTEEFPVLRFTPFERPSTMAGESVAVGSLEVTVGGFPHLVTAEEVSASVTSGASELGDARIEAIDPLDNGLAWRYAVIASPVAGGSYVVRGAVAGEYVGRAFNLTVSGTTEGIEVSFPPSPVVLEPAATGPLGVPVWAWALAGVTIAAGGALVVWISRKAGPYGYLYDDADRLVADFASLRRGPLRRLLARDRVGSGELRGLPFSGGTFMFSGDHVDLRYRPRAGDPSVRVNSRPAGHMTRLGRDVWIGAGGKLLTFLTTRRPEAQAPAAGDD